MVFDMHVKHQQFAHVYCTINDFGICLLIMIACTAEMCTCLLKKTMILGSRKAPNIAKIRFGSSRSSKRSEHTAFVAPEAPNMRNSTAFGAPEASNDVKLKSLEHQMLQAM